MIQIEPGKFLMGESDDDEVEFDEIPTHNVSITKPFYIGATEITNAQYEKFDPSHNNYRGQKGFSTSDNDAVLFVSWYDAKEFCEWLSAKEKNPYRLPTEAEWEYCCRAGTKECYFTGDLLPEEFHKRQIRHDYRKGPFYVPLSLEVAKTPANQWGLYDMHGNVEEWCNDWYGFYEPGDQIDPVGRESGNSKVTRSGSHHTDVHYLRSASRMAALPEDKSWYIGFRIVQAELPATNPLPSESKPLIYRDVIQSSINWDEQFVGGGKSAPIFLKPEKYVLALTPDSKYPNFSHQHCPAITWCPNGDLLAIYFSTYQETGREMVILGSRFRRGASSWEPSSVFFDVPDRNLTGESLFTDEKGTIFHFNGVEAAGSWSDLIMVLRTSNDNGETWSKPSIINSNHQYRNQVIACTIKTSKGVMIQCCDANHSGEGGTAVHLSKDNGLTWVDPGANQSDCDFREGGAGSTIAGIHASVAELKDGSFLAYGRGNNINGKMAQSISKDGGKTWNYTASEFPPISGGQRLILRRLNEGSLMFVSFTGEFTQAWNGEDFEGMKTLTVKNAKNQEEQIFGLFVAVSFDEGGTWPIKKVMGVDFKDKDGNKQKMRLVSLRHKEFLLDRTHGEPLGYMACCQTPDGMIHLISSRYHYRFNYSWLIQGK